MVVSPAHRMTALAGMLALGLVLTPSILAASPMRAGNADTIETDRLDATNEEATAYIDIEDVVKESFEVREGGTLYLEMDYGDIEIEVGSRNLVQIEMIRKVRVNSESEARDILDKHHGYTFEKDRDDVVIESRYRGQDDRRGRWNRSGKSKFMITMRVVVPERYNVDFVTGAGDIEIEDVEGEVNGKTGAGNIDIEDVEGAIEITSGAGNVKVEGVNESVEVNTGAGNIGLRNIRGFVRASTGAGNITARIMEQPDRDSRLESGAGNVTVYLASDVGIYVDAVASMGSASCECPLTVEGKWMKKSFEGEINGGGPDLFMRAGVGNVSLRKR